MTAATVLSDAKFRMVWTTEDGHTNRIAARLHIGPKRVRALALRLGLRKADYLTATEAARLLGLSVPYVMQLCQRGTLPAIKIHDKKRSRWRVTRGAVEECRAAVPTWGLRPYVVADGYITVADLVRRTGYVDTAIRERCRDGTISATKTPRGDWRIPESEGARLEAEVREQGRLARNPQPRPSIKEMVMYPTDLPGLLKFYLQRSGRSGNRVAEAAGMDPSALNRAASGQRGMSREAIDAVAGALKLTEVDHGRLLVAAGFCPQRFIVLGYDETFDAVADTMARLGEMELDGYRQELLTLSRRWRAR